MSSDPAQPCPTNVSVAIEPPESAESTEQKLLESLQRYRTILDTMAEGIVTVSEQGLIESFNRASEKIFGYAADEVIGHNVKLLMPEPDRGQHDLYVRNYVETGEAKVIGIGREMRGARKDGSTFPMHLSIAEVLLPDRRLFTGFICDISDRKNAEAEARRRLTELAQVARLASMGELAAVLAHEVNQPLTAIITHATACLRLLRSGHAAPELLEDSLAQIARQGERAGEVIKRLRALVREGTQHVIKPGDLNALVKDVLWLMQHELQAAGVVVDTCLDADLPLVEMDQVQIEQVVFNLAQNALEALVDAGREAPMIRVSTAPTSERDQPGIICRVADNGPGLGAKPADELFTAYFTTKANGLGQGLAICRTIIESHDGRIWAESPAEGGAVFCFYIPCTSIL